MKKVIALLLAAAMAVSMAGCSSSSSTASSAASTASSAASSAASSSGSSASGTIVSAKDTLNVEIATDPGDLSPYGVLNAVANNIKYQCMQPLFAADENNDWQPILVDTYEWKDDTHITITLKDNIYFSNGEKLTTADVMYTYETIKNNSAYSTYAQDIDFDNTKIVDEKTIEFALVAPTALFFVNECNVNICCKKAMEEDADGQKTNPIGSGPYKVTEYVTGDHITLEYNENYWNKANESCYIKKVICHIITESTQRVIALETGTVDFLWDVPTADYDSLASDSAYGTYLKSSVMTTCLHMNCTTTSVMQSKELRKAVATAVDAAAVTKIAYGDLGTPAFSFFTSAFSGVTGGAERYNNGNYCKGDIAAAKAIVDEYKAANPNADLHVKILTNGATDYSDALQVISNELNQAGFDAEIVSYESAVFYQMIQDNTSGEWDMYMLRAGGSGSLAQYFNNMFGSAGSNMSGIQNAELTELSDKIVSIVDETKTTETVDRIVEILSDENCMIPITQQQTVWAYRSGLEGVKMLGTAQVNYAQWYFSK